MQSTRPQPPTLKFIYWFFHPLEKLKTLPNDNGAVAAIMIALALFERFAKSLLLSENRRADKAGMCRIFGDYFGVDHHDSILFWETIRDGFLHQAMPVQKGHRKVPYPKWRVTQDTDLAVSFDDGDAERVIVIHPWRFVDEVVDMYRKNPKLIDSNSSFPWPLAGVGELGTG